MEGCEKPKLLLNSMAVEAVQTLTELVAPKRETA